MKNIARKFKNFIINLMSDVSISSPEDLYMSESERPAYFSTVPASSIPQGDQPWKTREEFRPVDPLPNKHFEDEKAWKRDELQQKQLFVRKGKASLPEASLLHTNTDHEVNPSREGGAQLLPEDFFADDEFTEEEEQTPQTYFPLLPFPEQRVDQRAPVHELPYKSNREMLLPPALHLPFPQSDGRIVTSASTLEFHKEPHPIMPIKMRSNTVYMQLQEAMERVNLRFGIQPGDLKLLNQFSNHGVNILDPNLCDQLNQSLDIITPDGIFNNPKTAQGAKIAYILQSLGCTLLDNGEFDIESIKKAMLTALLLPSSQRYSNDYADGLMQNLLRNNPVQMASWLAQLIQFGSVRVHGNFGFPLCNNVAIERLDNVLVDLCGLSLSAYLGDETETFSLNPTQAFSKLGYTVACRPISFVEYLRQNNKGINVSTIDRALASCVIEGLNHYLKALRELNDSQKASLLQKYNPDTFLMCFAIGRGRAYVLNVRVHPYLQGLFYEKIQSHDFSKFFSPEVLSALQSRNPSENLCGGCGPVLFDILCQAMNLKDIIAVIVYPDVEDMVPLGLAQEYVPTKAVPEDVTLKDDHDARNQQAATQENVAGIRDKLVEINQQVADIAKIVKSWLGFIKVGADRYQEFNEECKDNPPASRWEKFWRALFAMAGLTGKDHSEKDKEGDGAKKSEQPADKEQTAKNADAEKSPEEEATKNVENPQQVVYEDQDTKKVISTQSLGTSDEAKKFPAKAPRKRGRPKKTK